MAHGRRGQPVLPPTSLVGALAVLVGLTGGISALAQTGSERNTSSTTATTGAEKTDPGLREGGDRNGAGDDEEEGITEGVSGRIENVNPNMFLESARVESVNLDDTDEEFVVYRFGRLVNEVRQPSRFALAGFDVDARVAATGARLVQGDPASVLVAFPGGTDVTRYTIASVAVGAVEDEADEKNLPSSVALEGSTEGSAEAVTAGPDLVAAQAIGFLERVVYIYDEELDESSSPDAGRFGYYTLDGKMVSGAAVVTVDDNTVTVGYDRQVEEAVRFFASAGAAKNRRGRESSPDAVGGTTTAPDLMAFGGPIGTAQWDLVFDTPVSGVDLTRIALYSADGTRYTPTGFVQPAAGTVRIAVPEIHEFPEKMVLGTVAHGAVHSIDGSETPSTVGAMRLGGLGPRAGATSGPNLTGVEFDMPAGQIRFLFDGPVDDNLEYEPGRYLAVTAAGDLVPARFFVEANANSVLMTFRRNILGALAGVTLVEGAASDFQGERSPAHTIRIRF